MKNLKKVLSLVLAAAMAMSLMTTAFAVKTTADYTGAKDVTYTEAMDVMIATGIIDGVSGDLQAKGNVTREQAAKIICTMLEGNDAAKLSTTTAPFADVAKTRWSAGYIAYCVENGIVSGVGNNKFNPTGNVTGYEFAKMLLVALGYNATTEKYVGSNWAVNVASDATDAGLFDGNDTTSGNKAATREEACLYAFNTMKADLVKYATKGTNINVGDTNINVGASEAEPMTTTSTDNKYANIKNEKAGNPANNYVVQFAEKYFSDLKKTATSSDNFGRPASIWKLKTTEIGTYTDSNNLQATYEGKVTKGTLYTLVGKSVYNSLTAATNPTTLTVSVDGFTSTIAAANINNYLVSGSSATATGTGRGDTVSVYVDDNNNVNIVIVNTYLVQATGAYNATKGTLSIQGLNNFTINSTIKNDDVTVSSFNDEDYILVTAHHATTAGAYTIATAVAAETVSGNVTSYSASNDVTIGGTKYSYSAKIDATDSSNGAAVAYSTGDTAKVVLDSQNNIIYVDSAVEGSSNYVYVTKFAGTSSLATSAVAAAYFADGTYKEITLKKVGAVTDAATIAAMGTAGAGWYTYSVNSSDKYTLTTADDATHNIATSTTTGTTTKVNAIENNKIQIMANGTNGTTVADATVKANASTVFVVLDKNDDVTVYTGIAKVPTISIAAGATTKNVVIKAAYKTSNNYANYVFIDAKGASTIDDSIETSTDFVYVLNKAYTTVKDGDNTYYEYKALVNGEAGTVKADSTGVFAVDTLYNNVKTNSDGYATSANSINAETSGKYFHDAIVGTDTTVSTDSTTLTIGGVDYVLASNVKITLIVNKTAGTMNTDPDASYEITTGISSKSLASTLNNYTGVAGNVVGVYTSSTTHSVTELYVTITAATAK